MQQDRNQHCACPPGGNTLAPDGWCPRCGISGTLRPAALAAALAASNHRPAIEDARQAGWVAGYRAGLITGRRQVIDALANGDWLAHVTAAAETRYRTRPAVRPVPAPGRRRAAA